MPAPCLPRSDAIRLALQEHVTKRRNEALEKITGTDAAAEKERNKQRDFFDLHTLLASGAECVSQIQIATHILKGVHPDPKVKVATNLKVDPLALPDPPIVGTHVLRDNVNIDATGNGAFNKKVHEIFLLLQTRFENEYVLDMLKRGDCDAVAALSDHPEQATKIANNLADIDAARCARPASHTLAKQIYWLIGDDPHDDANYHLLAPLYPTSLVHRVHQTLQQDRFGEAVKAARTARKTGEWHDQPVHEYSNLAVQKIGGTKPQNISQLNSERRGDNYLLASLPPVWRSMTVKPLFGVESLFDIFGWRREVRNLTKRLRDFLDRDPERNIKTRKHRDKLVDALLDDLIQFTAEVRTLDPGWSMNSQCDLLAAHCVWLDPEAADKPSEGVIERVAEDFAHWLNARLRKRLPMGDPEYLYWRKLASEQLKDYDRENPYEQ